MIPEVFLREWREHTPWQTDRMVEQDFIICRSLVAIYSHPYLANRLAFRGGTALHKLHLMPARRYSEDIDLVQVEPGPIGPVFDALRECLGSFLGKPQRKQGPGVVTLTYRIPGESPSAPVQRLKVEINSREHFTVLEPDRRPFAVASRWFSGECTIRTYQLEELLGTKLRALYQRRKGRDLFDLWLALRDGRAQPGLIVKCFNEYMDFLQLRVSGVEFQKNMEAKLQHPDFLHDMDDLLRPGEAFDIHAANVLVEKEILSLL
jgi:predicted nucleotidyltransferase component of viral defense system